MKKDDFQHWLSSRGVGEKSQRTRIFAISKIESVMATLGSPFANLDDAFDDDGFAQLIDEIRALRKDAEAGGEQFRVLMPGSSNPTNRLVNSGKWLNQYGNFLREEKEPQKRSDWVKLEQLRDRFLERAPDFENFSQSSGLYFETERAYKDEIRGEIRNAVASISDEALLGQEIATALMPNSGAFLRWQTRDTIEKQHPDIAPKFFATIGKLALSSDDTLEAIWIASHTFEELRAQGADVLKVGEILSLIITVMGFVRPEDAAPFKITLARNVAAYLIEDKIFVGNICDRTQIEGWLALLRRIFDVMKDVWEWQPKDLLDVQGFAWIAMSDDWGDEDDEEDEPITLFDLARTPYVPVRQKNTATGTLAYRIKPAGATNAAVDAKEEEDVVAVARALLIDKRSVRIKPMPDGPVNYLTFANKLVGYELRPDIAEALGLPESYFPDTEPRSPSKQQRDQMSKPTNLILYGPPGTGKTYATVEEAVRLCDGNVPETREDAIVRYRQLVEAGQIDFVTFHQSYAYEDFVEGLRPTVDETSTTGGFSLEPRNGIFREISTLAEQARKFSRSGNKFDVSGRQMFKMSLGQAGVEEHIYEAAIEGGYIVLGWGGDEDWSNSKFENYDEIAKHWKESMPDMRDNTGAISQLWRFRSSMQEGDLVIVSEGNKRFRAIGEITGPYRYEPGADGEYNHKRDVRWLAVFTESLNVEAINEKNFSMHSCYLLNDTHLKKEAIVRLIPSDEDAASDPDQFVLIIDEINRANISKVFGELITLLEPDKRLGQADAITLKLPYSGDTFGVPSNLHIIGTMNTADRSIALLDTALRRRFTFRELMPQPALLAVARDASGVDLISLLHTMNNRIEYFFDREHQIGHAYFMECASRDDVDDVMRHKVIPLLTEYFYEDWEKVALVLGDINGEARFLERTELSSPVSDEEDLGERRWRWKVKETFTQNAYDGFV